AVFAARSHQLEAAEKLYFRCLGSRLHPEIETEIYFGLTQVLWQARRYEKLIEVCRKGLKDVQNAKRSWFHSQIAPALALQSKADEAIAEADQAVNLCDDEDRLSQRLNRVDVFRLVEKYDRALAECQELLKEYTGAKDVRDIRYTLSNIYSLAQDLPKAEE